MILRRHRKRLEEFVRPEAGAPDYEGGEMGGAVDEPGGPSSRDAAGDGRPSGNASKAEWVDYAVAQGADRDEAEAMSRNELREQYGA